jgi:hypothetical protein
LRNVSKGLSVGISGYAGSMMRKEKAGHPTYMDMSVGFTFLGQFQLKLAMRIGQLPVLAHQVMVHVGTGVVHALQK